MGSVMDYEKCKECGGVQFVDFYYKTGEEYRSCLRCGIHETYKLIRDENGVVLDKNEKFQYQHIKTKGYGVYGLYYKDSGVSQFGVFTEPITEEVIAEFCDIFSKPEVDKKRSYVAKFENNKQTVLLGEVLDDENTMDFDEFMKKWRQEAEEDESERVPIKELNHLTVDQMGEILENHIKEYTGAGDDIRITHLALIGSRVTGTNREDSDLDVAFQYSGEYRSDDVFNALNVEKPLEIEGIRIDFVPYASYKGEQMDKEQPLIWLPFKLPF